MSAGEGNDLIAVAAPEAATADPAERTRLPARAAPRRPHPRADRGPRSGSDAPPRLDRPARARRRGLVGHPRRVRRRRAGLPQLDGAGRYGFPAEIGLFVASLPGWLLLAKIYGLYDRDEERADHSTADEVFSVFNMLAVGTFGFYATTYLLPGLTERPAREDPDVPRGRDPARRRRSR